MKVKVSTIRTMSKRAPSTMISEFKNRADIIVQVGGNIDVYHLEIGDQCMVIGIDEDPHGGMVLNVYQRVA